MVYSIYKRKSFFLTKTKMTKEKIYKGSQLDVNKGMYVVCVWGWLLGFRVCHT